MFDALLTQVNSSHFGVACDQRTLHDVSKPTHSLNEAASFMKFGMGITVPSTLAMGD